MAVSQLENREFIEVIENGEEMEVLDGSEFILDPSYYRQGYSLNPEIKLRKFVIEKLREAKKHLPSGWNFKIWDGFRTLEVQGILYWNYFNELSKTKQDWENSQIHDAVKIFVSAPSNDPLSPPPHNTGGAVDLTLVDENGKEVPMGTEFDDFNKKAYTDHFQEGEFFKNRKILRDALEAVGMVNYPEEWWHFSYGDQMWAALSGEGHAIYGSMELN